MNAGINFFDSIFYINLDHRKDRQEKILKQLEILEIKKEKIVRIPAVLDTFNGQRGCALSHIKALELAMERNLNNVLILEDDCEFVQTKTIINSSINYFFNNILDWDVFFLGCQVIELKKTEKKEINRILKGYLAHAYCVNRNYFKKLKKCFENSYSLLEKDLFFKGNFELGIDRQWCRLQKKDRWLMLDKILAIQTTSFSDIEKMQRKRILI